MEEAIVLPNLSSVCAGKIFFVPWSQDRKNMRASARMFFAFPGLVECLAHLDFSGTYRRKILTTSPPQ